MARRVSSAGGGVSLFPFLSILACVIGILTLMISVTVVVKSSGPTDRDKEELRRAREYQSLLAQQRKLQQEIANLKKQLKTRNATALQLQELDERRIVLRRQLDDQKDQLTKAEKTDKTLQKLIENLINETEALRRERPALEKKLAELKEELARRKIKPDNKPQPVRVMPGGSGSAKAGQLFFVECDTTGLIIHRKGQPKTNVSTAAIGTDPNYNRFLQEAVDRRDAMVLFLIRDTGGPAYRRAAGWAENQFKLRTGKLPLPGKGEADLSLFFNP